MGRARGGVRRRVEQAYWRAPERHHARPGERGRLWARLVLASASVSWGQRVYGRDQQGEGKLRDMME